LIHTTHMLSAPVHVHNSYTSSGQSLYVATFHESSTILNRVIAPERKELLTTSPARRVIDMWIPIQFLSPLTTIEAVEKAKNLLMISYISLMGLYLQHVISTFNACSRVPIHRSLTDAGGGYNLGDVGFLHHTPRPSQVTVLRFPLVPRWVSGYQNST
jgi:hypothetical protein